MKFSITITLLFISFGLSSQNNSHLKNEIEKLKNDKELENGTWSVYAINIKKDSVIANYNSSQSLIPASTLKTVTTATALSILGSEFKFQTALMYDGIIDTTSHSLKGNIYIKGSGDPSLGSEYFNEKEDKYSLTDKWAKIILELGIKKIEGKIIGDASIFEDNLTPAQWIWGDMGNYYGAGACGLTYMDNKYAIHFKSNEPGTLTSIKNISPNIAGLDITNNVIALGSSDNAYIYGAPYTFNRFVEGTIPANKNDFEIFGSIPDPALFCAQSLEASLKNIGISANGSTTIKILKEQNALTSSTKKIFHTHFSPPLKDIVYWTNIKSNNLYAESLLKYISFFHSGFGTESKGIEFIEAHWKNKKIDVSGLYMSDGCGLARANLITTKTEAQILKIMATDKNFDAFYNSLPIAGKSGSLANMCNGSFAENNLRAKSGYITRVRSYTGYVKNKNGELICFSLIANNFNCSASIMKNKLEKIMIAISESQ